MIKVPDDFHVATPEHPTCTFFESFPGTGDPDDDYYCLPFCHMVASGKPAEICKGDYLICPLKSERLQAENEECHKLIDNVLDNRNVGMQTGDSTLKFRLAELVSYYADMQAEKKQVCEWGTHTLDELTDDWKFCPLCGKRIVYKDGDQ